MTTTKRRRPETAQNSMTGATADAAHRLVELSREPVRGAVLLRALSALVKLTEGLDRQTANEVAAEPTDIGVLVRLVEQTASSGQLDHGDPLADARLRWIQDRERLLSIEGPSLEARDVAHLLGVSRQAVAKARLAGRLIGLPIRRHVYRYPAWQFNQNGVLAGVPAVRDALGDPDPWIATAFLTAPNSRLDSETPLARLRQGNLDAVVRAARAYGEQGAA